MRGLLLALLLSSIALLAADAEAISNKQRAGLVERFSLAADRDTPDLSQPDRAGPSAFLLEASEVKEKQSPWRLIFRPRGGFDSNPATTTDAHGSAVAGFELEPSYQWQSQDQRTMLELAGNVDGRVYEGDTSDLNEVDLTPSLSLVHAFAADDELSRMLSFIADDRYVHVGEHSFQNVARGEVGYLHELMLGFGPEARFTFRNLEYFASSRLGRRDPDADRSTASIGVTLIPKRLVGDSGLVMLLKERVKKVRLAYSHAWNNADGPDFDYEGDGLTLKIDEIDLYARKLLLDTAYAPSWNDYTRANSLSPTGSQRQDHIEDLAATISWLAHDTAKLKLFLFAQYLRTEQRSNIDGKDYERHQGLAGIRIILGRTS